MATMEDIHQVPYNPSQLEFNQAMSDFQKMFPGLDAQVIETVLRANKGAVDITIDQLLTIASEDKTVMENSLSYNSPANTLPNTFSVMHRQLFPHTSSSHQSHMENIDLATGEGLPMLVTHNWRPVLFKHLPLDFLRVGSQTERQGVSLLNAQFLQERLEENKRQRGALNDASDPELTQFLEDERVALFLQNEEFMNELRGDQDFMRTLHQESCDRAPNDDVFAESTKFGGDDDAVFKEKLKNMGKVSKKKFTQLAKMFSRKRGAKDILDHGAAPSKDRLLLNSDPLLADDSDDENFGDVPSHRMGYNAGNNYRHH